MKHITHFITKHLYLLTWLTLILFSSQALFFSPLLDDKVWLTRTPLNAGSSGWMSVLMDFPFGAEYWRPLPTAYFALIASTFSVSTSFLIFKIIHLILFTLNLYVIYTFFKKILSTLLTPETSQNYALILILLLGLHPVTSEIGAWVSSIFDILVSLFSFSGSLILLHFLTPNKPLKVHLAKYILMLGFYTSALLSKENAIILIFTQIIIVFCVTRTVLPIRTFIKITTPITILIGAWISFRLFLNSQRTIALADLNLSFFEKIKLSLNTIANQFFDINFPFLNAGTVREWDTPINLTSPITILFFLYLSVVCISVLFYTKNTAIRIGFISFLCSILLLIPTSGLVSTPMIRIGWLYSDRFLFHSIPFLLFFYILIYHYHFYSHQHSNFRKIHPLLLGLFIIYTLFSASVWQQYSNHLKLIFTLASKNNHTGTKFLAHEYSNAKQFDKAEQLYLKELRNPPNNLHLKNELHKRYLTHLINTENWVEVNRIIPKIISHDKKFKPGSSDQIAFESLLRLSMYKTGDLKPSIDDQKKWLSQFAQAFDLVILVDILIESNDISESKKYFNLLKLAPSAQRNALLAAVDIEKQKLHEKIKKLETGPDK